MNPIVEFPADPEKWRLWRRASAIISRVDLALIKLRPTPYRDDDFGNFISFVVPARVGLSYPNADFCAASGVLDWDIDNARLCLLYLADGLGSLRPERLFAMSKKKLDRLVEDCYELDGDIAALQQVMKQAEKEKAAEHPHGTACRGVEVVSASGESGISMFHDRTKREAG